MALIQLATVDGYLNWRWYMGIGQGIGDTYTTNMQKSFKFYTAFPICFSSRNHFFICAEKSLCLQKKIAKYASFSYIYKLCNVWNM